MGPFAMILLAAGALLAQSSSDQPLFSLPYTPSLDPAAMDRSVDPCTNFYRYSCGAWIKNNPIPADQSRWDVYAKPQQDNQRFLWGLLQQAARQDANRTPVDR